MKRRIFLKVLCVVSVTPVIFTAVSQNNPISELESLQLPEGGREARRMTDAEERLAKLIDQVRLRNEIKVREVNARLQDDLNSYLQTIYG